MARYAEALPALGAGRFQVRRTLGEGGLGVVYEVHDQKRDALLALKSLRRPTPEALTRLKREFRALEELEHPNLVVLDELFEENGDWFFTMELVEGTDFLAYVRRAGGPDNQNARGCDEPRLRLALAQLASGLSALHNAGKIHRDVKPSNVLVTREGRVVLLDFGLVTEIDRAPDWTATHAVGSALYIAPEQAAGRPVGPEADWYAVGAMLYEALTERPIFTGSTLQILTEKQRRVPVSPQLLVPGVPLDLSVLALDLLRIEPDRRPSGPSVQRRVGGAAISGLTRTQSADIVCIDRVRAARTSNVSHQRNTLFVGRESELLALDQALSDVQRGGPVVVVVRGESGIGKSSLIRAFAARAESEGALVLRGRCYEREAVAYKAVDGVVESLAELLRRMSRLEAAAVVPRRASLLLRAFPALTRVSAMVGAGGQEAADPREMRIQLFQAFRELFTRLSEKRRLIIAIDDLQWADPESIALLSELLRPEGGPSLLFVGSFRSTQSDESAGLAFAALPGKPHVIELERLSRRHATDLARNLLEVSGSDPQRAEQVADAAAGHPMFLDELARFSSANPAGNVARVEDALWARLEKLEPKARRLVELYAIAGAPLPATTAARAAQLTPAELSRHLSALRVLHIVRTSGDKAREASELHHDSVRRAVRAHLDEAAARELHGELARALRATGQGDFEQLARHYQAAGDLEHAVEHLLRAAEQAEHALAFVHAARLYAAALALWSGDPEHARNLSIRLADALSSAGRGLESARAYQRAAEGADAALSLDLSRRAAQELLLGGHIDAGIEALENVLASEGIALPRSHARTFCSVTWGRMARAIKGYGFERKDPSEVPAHAKNRADLCFRAGIALSMVDTSRALSLCLRAIDEAMHIGDAAYVARAVSVYATHLSSAGGPAEAKADKLLNVAETLANEADSAHALAVSMGSRGQARYLCGRFRAAVSCCSEAERLARDHCTGMYWGLNTSRLYALRALLNLGEVAEVNTRVPTLIEECKQREDLYGEVGLAASVLAPALLAQGRAREARELVKHVEQRWSPRGFHVQHYDCLTSKGSIDLHEGKLAEAQAACSELGAGLERSMLRRVQLCRVNVHALSGRVALASARPGDLRALAAATHFERRLRGEHVDWATPQADLLRAGIESARGNVDGCHAALVSALRGFEATEMRLHAACARYCLGKLRGGDAGAELVAAALSSLDLQGAPAQATVSFLAPRVLP